jgi:hypothetical protein
MTGEQCGHCPADPGDVCVRWTTGHARLCELAATRDDYRRLIRERSGGTVPPRPVVAGDPRLALVAACPDRGSVLPHTLQPSCGCAELTACRRGKGTVAGRVTLADCLACVAKDVEAFTP